ncbi:GGDEF domain-containing protein [Paenibacillus sp. CC-CFT747]|nr:GGDEF domain-containing protein [Paenibacillus sp. CC-CFT747]
MTSKSGKVFSLGHLIVPLILVTLSLQAKPGQAFLLGLLALLTLGWAVFLLFHSYYLNRSYPFERRKTYLAFMMIDFAWLTAVSCLPDWSASEIRPVWLVLFPVALYAFEGGMLHSLGMSLLGMISLYLFTEYQGLSFWSVEVFLTAVGMAALVGFIGWRTERLNRIAYYDGLTGLPNRLMMVEKLQAALSQRRPSSSAAVLLLDLDQFKYVNDTMGHDTGDDLLKSVAHRIGQVLPRSAMLARMGGDEFSVLMPSLSTVTRPLRLPSESWRPLRSLFPEWRGSLYRSERRNCGQPR